MDISDYKLCENALRDRFIELLKPQITDEELFRKEWIFRKDLTKNEEVDILLKSELEKYTEKGTLRLAEILWDAGNAPSPVTETLDGRGIHWHWKFHRLACLCLYERAAQNESGEGYYRASQLYYTGECGIPKNSVKATEYSLKAKELGYKFTDYENIIKLVGKMPIFGEKPKKKSFWDKLMGR